jgi:hypothetical protein
MLFLEIYLDLNKFGEAFFVVDIILDGHGLC